MKKFAYELRHCEGPWEEWRTCGIFTSLPEVRSFIQRDPDLIPENYDCWRHNMNPKFGGDCSPVLVDVFKDSDKDD